MATKAVVKKAPAATIKQAPKEKKYVWKGEDEIPMLGADFQTLFNGMKKIIEDEKNEVNHRHMSLYTRALLLNEMGLALDKTFSIALQKGVIKVE